MAGKAEKSESARPQVVREAAIFNWNYREHGGSGRGAGM